MSGSPSNHTFESEDDTNSWLSSDNGMDDEDELTLLNGDENSDDDSTTFAEFLRLALRLKRQYNLRDASVALERCDKIWDTMQLLKKARTSSEDEIEAGNDENTDDEDYEDEEELEEEQEEVEEEDEECTEESKTTSDAFSCDVAGKTVSYIKYQPTQGNGNNALPNFYLSVKKQRKIYNCTTCGKIYSEKRAFRLHAKRDHGIVLPSPSNGCKRLGSADIRSTRSKNPQYDDSSSAEKKRETGDKGIGKNSEAPYHCPICKNQYMWRSSLRYHAADRHGINIDAHLKRRCGNKLETKTCDTATSVKSDAETDSKSPAKPLEGNYMYRYLRTRYDTKSIYYLYICITCDKKFRKKNLLRIHAHKAHGMFIPAQGRFGICAGDTKRAPKQRRTNGRGTSGKPAALSSNDEVSKNVGKPVNANRQRAGPKSSKVHARSQQSCVSNAPCNAPANEESDASQSGRSAKCFLCKNSFVDIKKHLVDYHRISRPDNVFPLNKFDETVEEMRKSPWERTNKIVVKRERESPRELTNVTTVRTRSGRISTTLPKCETQASAKDLKSKMIPPQQCTKPKNIDDIFKSLSRKVTDDETGRSAVQCKMCSYKYADFSGLKRHLLKQMVNGVVQQHEVYKYDMWSVRGFKRKRRKKNADTPIDASELSQLTDSTERPDENESSSDKHGSSFSDVSSSMSETIPSKRRKIGLSNSPDVTYELSETRSVNREIKAATKKSHEVSRYNLGEEENDVDEDDGDDDDEDKNVNERDTRDSSDRDSGIGISITIKKRNNYYEVVEKDNYGDKTKHYDNVKDVNVLDSALCAMDFCDSDGNVDSREREIFDTSNYGEIKRKSADATSVDKNRGEDVTVLDDTGIGKKCDEIDDRFGWNEKSCDREACAKIPDRVSSLRLSCGNSLIGDEASLNAENTKEFSSMSGLL